MWQAASLKKKNDKPPYKCTTFVKMVIAACVANHVSSFSFANLTPLCLTWLHFDFCMLFFQCKYSLSFIVIVCTCLVVCISSHCISTVHPTQKIAKTNRKLQNCQLKCFLYLQIVINMINKCRCCGNSAEINILPS